MLAALWNIDPPETQGKSSIQIKALSTSLPMPYEANHVKTTHNEYHVKSTCFQCNSTYLRPVPARNGLREGAMGRRYGGGPAGRAKAGRRYELSFSEFCHSNRFLMVIRKHPSFGNPFSVTNVK